MQALMSFVVLSLFSGFISCHEENNNYNSTYFDEEFWDLESDVTDDGIKDEITTELEEFDSGGYEREQQKQFIDSCDEATKVANEVMMMEDGEKRKKAVCSALKDFVKCILTTYGQTNCAENAVLRNNLKAAHLFLILIEHINCTEFRGQCAYYNSAVVNYAGYTMVLFSVLVLLTMYWRL